MVSKRFSQKKLDQELKAREVRKAQIQEAIQAAMTSSNGTRREYFDAVDLVTKLKTIDVNDLHNWTYDSAKKLIDELLSSGVIVELEHGRRYVPRG